MMEVQRNDQSTPLETYRGRLPASPTAPQAVQFPRRPKRANAFLDVSRLKPTKRYKMNPNSRWIPTIESLLNPTSPERDTAPSSINAGYPLYSSSLPRHWKEDADQIMLDSSDASVPSSEAGNPSATGGLSVNNHVSPQELESYDYMNDLEMKVCPSINDRENENTYSKDDQPAQNHEPLHDVDTVHEQEQSNDGSDVPSERTGEMEQASEVQEVTKTRQGRDDDCHRFDIDKILDFKVDQSTAKVQFLIKWAVEPTSEATWEEEYNIQEDCPAIVYKFWKARRGRIAATGLDTYHVFRILSQKFDKKRNEQRFKVQWVGYPLKDASFENEEYLEENASGLLEAWRRERG